MNNAFSAETVLDTLPPVLAEDKKCYAIAYAIAQKMEEAFSDVHNAIIYARVNELDEATLDQLAEDFGIWWYRGDNTLAQKRQTIYDSFVVQKRLGTKPAIIKSLRFYFGFDEGQAGIDEWFDLQSPFNKPGHYIVNLSGEYSEESYADEEIFMHFLDYVSRWSAILDLINYPLHPIPPEPEID